MQNALIEELRIRREQTRATNTLSECKKVRLSLANGIQQQLPYNPSKAELSHMGLPLLEKSQLWEMACRTQQLIKSLTFGFGDGRKIPAHGVYAHPPNEFSNIETNVLATLTLHHPFTRLEVSDHEQEIISQFQGEDKGESGQLLYVNVRAGEVIVNVAVVLLE